MNRVIHFLTLTFIGTSLMAQDKWSDEINELNSIDELHPQYGPLLVEIAWQISDLNADTAMYYAEKALELGRRTKDDSITARALIGLSTAVSIQGRHSESITYCVEALQLAESIDDTVSIIDAANNIGIDYYYLEDWPNSLAYFQKCVDIVAEAKKDRKKTIQFAHSIMNVALVQAEMGNRQDEIKNYQRVIQIFKSIDYARGYSNALFNLGKTYHELEQYDNALKYYEESSKAFQQNEFMSALADVTTTWARMLFEQRKYQAALKKLQSGIEVADSTKNTLQLQYGYGLAHEIFASMGRYDSAYYYQAVYQEVLSESREQEKQEYAEELRTQYETEKKERQIARLEQENRISELEVERQGQQRLFLLILAVLLIVIVVMFYIRSKAKSRTNVILTEKNEELAELNLTKDRLFSIISHDLKNPLSSFHTITKSLTDNWEVIEKDQMKEFITSLKDSSKEVHDMMDNLLRWALSQTGQLKYQPVDMMPESAIDEVVRQLESPLKAQQIELNVNTEGMATIKADVDYLKIILRNLITNAIKFSELKSSINVVVEQNQIMVSDHGVGIKPEDVSKLFRGGVHEIKNSSKKGTGLGLTLCKELMQAMGGEIHVESEYQKGTTFRLVFAKAA